MNAGPAQTLAVIALAIIIAPLIARWLRLPGIIGFVIAGAVAGPYMIGLLGQGRADAIGAIGLLYLMFQAGLEIDMATFDKYRSAAIIFGLLTFTFPFCIGMAEGWFVLKMGALSAILIGSIWASHTLVTLPDVREAGLSSNRAVTTTAGATIITDTLALVILALVTGAAGGTGSPMTVIVVVVAGLISTAALCLVALPWLGRRYFAGIGQDRTMRFAFLLLSMAAGASCAELFGIDGLVGAFAAGLGVNRLVPKAGPLMERVDFFGAALLVPGFLVYVGTKLNPAVVVQPSTVLMAVGFFVALVVGKSLAAVVGSRILKFSWDEAGLMFGMSVPQAAATLAATLAGASAGLFTDQVVNAVVLVVLVSILVGSLVTRYFAQRVEMPSGAARPIGEIVLVGLPAGVSVVGGLMRAATAIASGSDGIVLPVAVATEGMESVSEADVLAHAAEDAASAAGADVESRVRRSDSYASAMLDAVADRHASLVVTPFDASEIGSGRVMGTELERLGRESSIPVMAARITDEPFSRVVLGLDRASEQAAIRHDVSLAARVAVSLAENLELPLVAVAHDEAAVAGVDLPEDAEIRLGEQLLIGDPSVLPAGSALVVPASLVRRFGSRARAFAEARGDVSILVVAGPKRLRLTSGAPPNPTIMGWGGQSLAEEAAL